MKYEDFTLSPKLWIEVLDFSSSNQKSIEIFLLISMLKT